MRVLEGMGYRVVLANNGREALEALRNKFYPNIFMDVQMPEMNGLEASMRIREAYGDLPYIVALTANVTEGDKALCLNAGMNDFAAKPIRLPLLPEIIKTAYLHYSASDMCV